MQIRKGLKNQDVYENFLRCITLYNHEVVSKNELVVLVTPFLGKFPELLRWFKEFVCFKEENAPLGPGGHHLESVANSVARPDRPTGDLAMEIGKSTSRIRKVCCDLFAFKFQSKGVAFRGSLSTPLGSTNITACLIYVTCQLMQNQCHSINSYFLVKCHSHRIKC